jgi:hypothetical protein
MLITKPYFLIIQGFILLVFGILGLMKKENKYFIFSSRLHFVLYLIGSIMVGYFFNKDFQLFCIPVKWTKILLIAYSFYLIGSWIFKKVVGEIINQIILGIGLFVSIYIILFGSFEYLIWCGIQLIVIIPIYFFSKFLNKKYNTRFFDALNFYGATIFLPYIIIAWTIWQVMDKKLIHKISLITFPMIFLFIGFSLTIRMNRIINEINQFDNKVVKVESMINNQTDRYLIELILGAHWKYHTKICLYDGWRPPFHDPILGFAQPFLYFREQFNYEISLPERTDLYKKVFPENEMSFDCKCAKYERL